LWQIIRKVYVKPVFKPDVDYLKDTPKSGRNNDEKGKVSVTDNEPSGPYGNKVVNEDYVGPPENEVCKVLKRFYPSYEEKIRRNMD
jgi:hypothetical protein